VTARRRRRALIAAAAATAVLAGAGCGLAEDDRPEVLAADNVPHGLLDPDPPATTTSAPLAAASPVQVFFVEQQEETIKLRPVERLVSDPTDVEDRIQVLLDEPPVPAHTGEEGLSSSIPPGTSLLQVEVDLETREAVVDLSREFFGSQGTGQRAAFAQITCTAEQVDGVAQVRFKVEGEPIAPVIADATQKDGPVSCLRDYATFQLDLPAETTPPRQAG
jgi:hypothetical protein